MLYNKDLKKLQKPCDCLTCPKFDKKKKECKGIGAVCFEYDPITKTAIDPVTHLPIRLN